MKVNNLKSYLASINMKVMEFAQIVECHHTYISRICHGRDYPGKKLAKEIFKLTGGVVDLATRPKKPRKKNEVEDGSKV